MQRDHEWVFSEDALTIQRGEACARLTRKAASVLACLVRHTGDVVSSDQILREVWPHTYVTSDLVREYVFDLRIVLGDNAQAPSFIETIRGKGYRLIGGVRFAPKRESAEALLATVAVLPMENAALDARWWRFGVGLAEDIAYDLGRYPDIAVIARHAAEGLKPEQDPRAVAERIGARYLVLCDMSVASARVRIRVTLVDGASGRILWNLRRDCNCAELPSLIDEVAAGVAGALGGMHGEIARVERRLVQRKPPSDLDAYEHYLLACDAENRFDRESSFAALDHIEQALARDPEFGRNWLVLAMLCKRFEVSRWGAAAEVWQERYRDAVMRGVEVDPRDPMLLTSLAILQATDGQTTMAAATTERAMDLVGSQADACVYLSLPAALVCGAFDAALSLVDRGIALNPSRPGWYAFMESRAAFYAGDFGRAITAAQGASPYIAAFVYPTLSAARLAREDQARSLWQDLLRAYPSFDFAAYAKEIAIVSPKAQERYWDAAEQVCRFVHTLEFKSRLSSRQHGG